MVISIIAIGPNIHPSGVKIINTNTTQLSVGDVIYKINDIDAEKALDKEYNGLVKLITNKGVVFLIVNKTLPFKAEPLGMTNLVFGLDIKGGIRAIVEPVNNASKDTMQQALIVLQNRINLYGLRESNFRLLSHANKTFIEITISGGTENELKRLLEHKGQFEARIPLYVNKLVLEKSYDIILKNNSIILNNKEIKINETFRLENIDFVLSGVGKKANITAIVFTSNDIKFVYYDPQRSFIRRMENGFQWTFAVELSDEGALKFSRITNNLDIIYDPMTKERYLSSKLYLYLDNKFMDSLNIAASLKGKEEKSPAITGYASTYKEAMKEKQYFQTILRSGSLPIELRIVEIYSVSPKLGIHFLSNIGSVVILALLTLSIVVFIRFRSVKISLLVLCVSLSELIIILGVASAIHWTIDLSAIAGILAAIGTGVDNQIVIIDQAFRKIEKEMSLRHRITRAFFIIFTSAGTTIAAMFPLVGMGFGMLRGFALTTMLGVLIGVFITRPAFANMVEELLGK